ncbi:MAG: hypothetical protein LUB58_02305 [Oscillospiraceae bacterium]|nr:hypothetical protein [Oscillospiraceae bacterium]
MKKQQIAALAVGLCAAGALLAGCQQTGETVQPETTVEIASVETASHTEHEWIEATCTVPKTCAVCGETEGEALGHSFAAANYQQPAVCTVCGETEGDVLPADFDTCGLRCDAVAGKALTYKTTGEGLSGEVIGTVTFYQPEVLDSCPYFETPEGYVSAKMTISLTFNASDVTAYGIAGAWYMEDFYSVTGRIDSVEKDGAGVETFTLNWNGEDYTQCHYYEAGTSASQEAGSFYVTIESYYCIPEGYDGAVFAVYNANSGWVDGSYVFDLDNTDSVFYRLPALTAPEIVVCS